MSGGGNALSEPWEIVIMKMSIIGRMADKWIHKER